MRAEFYRPDDPETVVGLARWDGRRPQVEASDDEMRSVIRRIFRPSPVVADDPSLRPLGTKGESVLQPGSLEWFRTAAITRAPEDGLVARLVPEVPSSTGWDPASAYRTFRQVVTRLESPATGRVEPTPEVAKPV
ncbi:MAG: hypothetical protein ACJ77A_06005 [Actinomycetota bacterium]